MMGHEALACGEVGDLSVTILPYLIVARVIVVSRIHILREIV